MKDIQKLEGLRELLLENLPRSIERLSKSRGSSQTLPRLSEAKLTDLIYDTVNEMRARRPQIFSEMEYPFLVDGRLLGGNGSGSNQRVGRESLRSLTLSDFELLCYEVCVEIERRYLTGLAHQNPPKMQGKSLDLPTSSNTFRQPNKKWQICNAMNGDWSDSDISCDEGASEDELPSSLSDASEETVDPRAEDSEEKGENMSARLNFVCARLMSILRDRSRYKLLLGYRDLEAQAILNLLQNLLDSPLVHSTKLKKELAVAVQRLSKKSALYPECFVLKDISIEKTSDGSIHTLSSGKFGDVWRGSMQGQNVCLKVMRVYRNSKIHELLKIFSCEAVLWGQLRHTNVLPFYGVYRLEHPSYSRICLVSPWMQNGNVDEYLAKEHDANRLSLVIDVATGLRYLHAQNIVHGDLKGANVLVNSAGRACLADFGLSTIRDPEVLALSTTNSSTCGGTVRWMAPELLSSQDNDEQISTKECDIYAFAGVCYEIFTGHVPFYEVFRDQTVILKVNRGERPSHPDHEVCLGSGLSEAIWRLMQDCWLTLPEDRPTASEVIGRLNTVRKAAKKSRVVLPPTPPSGRSTPTQSSRLQPALQKTALVPPSIFRASFSQANLESQLRRKDLLKLLDVSTEPLLDYS